MLTIDHQHTIALFHRGLITAREAAAETVMPEPRVISISRRSDISALHLA